MTNVWVAVGRIAAAPEIRYTPSGKAVAEVRLAVQRDWKNDETGERDADFFDVQCWESLAETIGEWGAVGRLISVTCRLQVNNWTNSDGQRRSRVVAVCNHLSLLDKKPE